MSKHTFWLIGCGIVMLSVGCASPIKREAELIEVERLRQARLAGNLDILGPRVAVLGERAQVTYMGVIINDTLGAKKVEAYGPVNFLVEVASGTSRVLVVPKGSYYFYAYDLFGRQCASKHLYINSTRDDSLIEGEIGDDFEAFDWFVRISGD